MQEDKLLVRKLKHGDGEALHRIYEKYKNELLALSVALSGDRTLAEDVVHDVFVSFAEFAGRLQLRGSLKSYLSSCVANRVRSLARAEHARSAAANQPGRGPTALPAAGGHNPALAGRYEIPPDSRAAGPVR